MSIQICSRGNHSPRFRRALLHVIELREKNIFQQCAQVRVSYDRRMFSAHKHPAENTRPRLLRHWPWYTQTHYHSTVCPEVLVRGRRRKTEEGGGRGYNGRPLFHTKVPSVPSRVGTFSLCLWSPVANPNPARLHYFALWRRRVPTDAQDAARVTLGLGSFPFFILRMSIVHIRSCSLKGPCDKKICNLCLHKL